MERYLSILEMVLGRATYIALLNQYPDAADRVGRMLAVSVGLPTTLLRIPWCSTNWSMRAIA